MSVDILLDNTTLTVTFCRGDILVRLIADNW